MNFGKVGKFKIAAEIVRTNPEQVRMILAECLIIHCEMRLDTKSLEYIAFNEQFDDVGEGNPAPEYRCLITLHRFQDRHMQITHEWERVK